MNRPRKYIQINVCTNKVWRVRMVSCSTCEVCWVTPAPTVILLMFTLRALITPNHVMILKDSTDDLLNTCRTEGWNLELPPFINGVGQLCRTDWSKIPYDWSSIRISRYLLAACLHKWLHMCICVSLFVCICGTGVHVSDVYRHSFLEQHMSNATRILISTASIAPCCAIPFTVFQHRDPSINHTAAFGLKKRSWRNNYPPCFRNSWTVALKKESTSLTWWVNLKRQEVNSTFKPSSWFMEEEEWESGAFPLLLCYLPSLIPPLWDDLTPYECSATSACLSAPYWGVMSDSCWPGCSHPSCGWCPGRIQRSRESGRMRSKGRPLDEVGLVLAHAWNTGGRAQRFSVGSFKVIPHV